MQPKITKAEVAAALQAAGLKRGTVVYFHSMLIGRLECGADTVIEALIETVGPEGTIVMPTFTWERLPATPNPPVLQQNTHIWTGRIPRRFLEYPGVLRDRHPLWSNAYWGRLAEEMVRINEAELFGYGEDKVAYRIYQEGGSTFMFACSFKSCSSMYVVHDLMDLPYRQPLKRRRGHSVPEYLSWSPEEQLRFINFEKEYRSGAYRLPDFSRIEEPLRAAGVLMESSLTGYKLMHVRLADLYRVMREEHARRPDLLFP